jgi:hypothetical protein
VGECIEIMAKSSNQYFSSSCLDILSMAEGNVSVLYTALAGRVEIPAAKSLFMSFAKDNHKHSVLLKNACKQLSKTQTLPQGNEKLEDVFRVTYTIYKEIITKEEAEQQLVPEELLALAQKLLVFEKMLCEKYVLAQTKTLKFLGRENFVQQHFSLDNYGSLFARLIDDSEQHQKHLHTVKSLIEGQTPENANDVTVTTGLLDTAEAIVEPCLAKNR